MDTKQLATELLAEADKLEAHVTKLRKAAEVLNGSKPRRKPGRKRRQAATPEGPLRAGSGSSTAQMPSTSAGTAGSPSTAEPAVAGVVNGQQP